MSATRPTRYLIFLASLALTVAVLYFGQPVLLPVAIAVLLTFMLRPVVLWLERRRVPRAVAVVAIVIAIFAGIGGVGYLVVVQFNEMASNVGDYKETAKEKLRGLSNGDGGTIAKVRDSVTEVIQETEEEAEPADGAGTTDMPRREDAAEPPSTDAEAEPQPVRVVSDGVEPGTILATLWTYLSTPLAIAALVVVLTIFMLIDFEELRNRVIRLAGAGQISMTTKTLDEASKRIGRYLMATAMINSGFGFVLFIGLWLIGVHYALLWGVMAALLRYIPYLGPTTATVLPIGMALIQFPGWTQPLLTIGLFVVMELIMNNAVEPLAYGKTAGVATVPLLVSAAFWTWCWGPVGLALAIPITVMLAVVARHVPRLEALAVVLGDQPALPPYVVYYQRLLAGDTEEAEHVAEEHGLAADRRQTYDDLLIPALTLAERDRNRDELSAAQQQFIWQAAKDLVQEAKKDNGDRETPDAGDETAQDIPRIGLFGIPCHDEADEIALEMLRQVLPEYFHLETAGLRPLVSELLETLAVEHPSLVVISALGPSGASQTRYFCKRIKQRFPNLEILVGRWGYEGDRQRLEQSLADHGATHVALRLEEAVELARRIQPGLVQA